MYLKIDPGFTRAVVDYPQASRRARPVRSPGDASSWRRSPSPRCPISSCCLGHTPSRGSARALSA